MAKGQTSQSWKILPDGPTRHRSTSTRIYLLVTVLCLCLVLALCGILAPILELQSEDNDTRDRCIAEEERIANHWMAICRNSIVNTVSAVYCMQGFILGQIQTVPPFNGTIEERVKGQWFPRFHDVGEMVNETTRDLSIIISAPGGVFLQSVPYFDGVAYTDILNRKSPMSKSSTMSPIESVDTGSAAVIGPQFIEDEQCDLQTWGIIVRQPVYATNDFSQQSRDTFWGFVYVIMSIDTLLEMQGFKKYMGEYDVDYLLYTTKASGEIVPIATSLPSSATQAQLKTLADAGTVRSVFSQIDWFIAVYSKRPEPYLSQRTITTIVTSSIFGSIAIFAIACMIILYCTRAYDGKPHAPQSAPFAMLTIGPCDGDELWNLASDQMVDVTEKLKLVLDKAMAAHHAYPIAQLRPSTSSYTTRSVDAAVSMAFSVIEELQSHPIDGPLCRLLGEDGRLLVSCAVHWCEDASVTTESCGALRYEGPDVVYGGRMWVFASPNAVTLSGSAKDVLKPQPNHDVLFFNSVYLRGVTERQNLFVVTDHSSKRMCEAAAVAEVRLRRAREAQRRQVELESNSTSDCGQPNSGSSAASIPVCGGTAELPMPGTRRQGAFGGKHCPSSSRSSSTESTASQGQHSDTAASNMMMVDGRVLLRPQRRSGSIPKARPDMDGNAIVEVTRYIDVSDNGAATGSPHRNAKRFKASTTKHIDVPANPLVVPPTQRRSLNSGDANALTSSGAPNSSSASSSNNALAINEGINSPVVTCILEAGPLGDANVAETTLAYALLHPSIAAWLDATLRSAFEHHAVAIDVSYDSVRVMVYYFFCSFKLLFRPLAAPERVNIYRRLMTAFGVPQQGILEHLAARCTILYMQQHEESKSLLWDHQQQRTKKKKQKHHHKHNHHPQTIEGSGNNTTVVVPMQDAGLKPFQ